MKPSQRLPAPFAKAGLLFSFMLLLGCSSSGPDNARNTAVAAVQSTMGGGPAFSFAGVSVEPNQKVVPLDSATLPGPIKSHDLHMFRHRCGACHKVPDPRMKYEYEWSDVVAVMQNKADNGGLLAFSDSELKSIRRFLSVHAPTQQTPQPTAQ